MSAGPSRPDRDRLTVRDATDADVDAIVALETAAFGASDGPAVRTYLASWDGPRRWAVACAGDRVVSASARLPHRFALDGTEFGGAQIEYVATDPAYQRRGLVRAQFDHHHRCSAAEGDLAQFVGGIPYLYRRFGYGYGLDHPQLFLFDPTRVPSGPGPSVRPASAADLDALVQLEADRPTQVLRTVRDADRWRVLLALAEAGPCEQLLVAERDGEVTGWTRLHLRPEEDRLYLLPSMARDASTVDALVQAGLQAAGSALVVGFDNPGTRWGRRLAEIGAPFTYDLGIYTRVPDPVALVDHLRPVLTARLADSAFADHSGELTISLYETGLALTIEQGSVVGVECIAGEEDPFDDAGVGVAPDWFGALVFGRWGAGGLAARADDVTLGKHGALMEVLFPRRPSDVAGDF